MATQASAHLILELSCSAATYAAKKYLEQQGFMVDVESLTNDVKMKFDEVIHESGAYQSIKGRATTIDQAISGNMRSAYRNNKYMSTVETIKKLESDLYKMRMMLENMDINRDARVLNSLFKVRRNENKSSSIIEVSAEVYDKLERGELISINDDHFKECKLNELSQELEEKNQQIRMLKNEIMQHRAIRLNETELDAKLRVEYESKNRRFETEIVVDLESRIVYLEKLVSGLARKCGYTVEYV